MKRDYKHKFAFLFLELSVLWISIIGTANSQIISAPTLVSPSNGAANQLTTLTLQWNSVSAATSYSVQVATDAAFNNILVNQSGLTGTSYQVSGLTSNTTYYWRALASSLIFTSSWSSVWSFSTIPTSLSAPALLSPTNGTSGEPTTLILTWSSITGAINYHLQVSNSSAFSSLIYDNATLTGTSEQISSLSNSSTFYWRVSASNSSSTSSWSSTWSFTTTTTPPLPNPSVPTLASPSDGSTNQPTTIVLDWNSSANADHYWVQIATDSTFSNPTIGDSSVTLNSYQVNNLSASTNYFWRVKGLNSSGSSNWSTVWNFTTVGSQVQLPSQPTLSVPINGSTNQPTTITLSWNSAANADHYWIQVATDQTFTNMVYTNYAIVGTSQQVSGLLNNKAYYWQVRGVNAGGQGPWSVQWTFTTTSIPPPTLSAPVLISPINSAQIESTSVAFKWDSVNNATTYHFQLSTSSAFNSITNENSSLTSISYQVISLLNNQQYYWRVSANNINNNGPWSNISSFTTKVPPPVPAPISPPNDSTITPTNITFAWSQVSNAEYYHIQISTSASFNNIIVDDSLLTVPAKTVDSLSPNKIFYWRVLAKDSTTKSPWSNTQVVKTASQPNSTLAAPSLTAPPNGSINQPTSLTLQWSSVSGASSYSVQVSTDSSFNNLVVNQSGLSNNSYQVSGLSNNTTYFWRAGSSSLILFSGWSGIWSFTTTPSVVSLSPPTLTSPANGSVNEPVSLKLQWTSVSGASTYNLQVGIDSNFSSIVFNKNGIVPNYQQVDSLAYNQVYYWRVSASNNSSSSLFSAVWKFSTTSNDTNIAVPQTPVLSSPVNSAVDEPLYPILNWNASSNASSYHLQLSTDSTFTNVTFDDSLITSTYYQVGQLNQNTKYYWHVSAKNTFGISNWSAEWHFQTQQVTSNIPVLVSPNDGSKNQSLTEVCIWDSVPNVQFYDIQLSTTPDFSKLVIDDSTIKTTSVVLKNLTSSTTYFWHVKAKVDSVWNPFSSAWEFTTRISNPTFSNIDTTLTFPSYTNLSQFKSSDYKLVGIPGAGNFPLSTFLTGSPFNDWVAYWDNGAPSNYLVEYNSGGSFIFSTGTAFWILKKGFLIIDTTTEDAPLNSNGQVDLPLHSGWNIITDPFTYPVSWSKIQSANSVTEPIYSFNGNFQNSSTLSPYIGYYFFNATNLTTLEIPAQVSSPGLQKIDKTNSASEVSVDWEIRIKLNSGSYCDSLAWLGVSSNVNNGYNHFDVHKPRNIGSVPTVYFYHPEWNSDYPVFASDIKPSFDTFAEWNIKVDSKPWRNDTLVFEGLDNVPEQYEVYIHNAQSNTWSNLENENTFKFVPTKSTTSFSILIGTSNEVNQKIKDNSVHKSSFALGNNFPNPFNNSTEIPVYVPTSTEIQIVIYNVIGKVIKTIVSGPVSEGEHLYQWNGTDDLGNIASSGIYFYRIIAGSSFSQIKKMILLK